MVAANGNGFFYQVKNKNSVRMSETRMSTVRKINLLKPIPKHIHGCECKTEPWAYGSFKYKKYVGKLIWLGINIYISTCPGQFIFKIEKKIIILQLLYVPKACQTDWIFNIEDNVNYNCQTQDGYQLIENNKM